MKRLALLAAIVAAALTVSGIASATTTTSWTPANVASTLQQMTPLTNSNGVWLAHGFIKTPSCRTSNRIFVCTAIIHAGVVSERATLWVKPWTATSLCVSRIALVVCGSAPTRNDPRMCGRTIADGCLVQLAARAVQAKQSGGLAVTCAPAGPFKFTCTGNSAHTVKFTKGATAWTTSVTP